jgi:hypothetical protein
MPATDEHHLARPLCDASECSAGGRRADERALAARESLHAGLVAEDAAPGDGARGVDGEHGDAVPGLDQKEPEGFDETALADTRGPRDADARGAPREGHQGLEHGLALGGQVVARALQQRDGARERAPVAASDRLAGRRDALRSGVHAARDRITSSTSRAALGIAVPGPKIAATPASRRKA